MTLVQELDARGRPLVIPVLAVTGASLDIRSDEAAELLEGLERLGNAMTAALLDRLTHHCHFFEVNGESYRLRESMKAKKGRKAD